MTPTLNANHPIRPQPSFTRSRSTAWAVPPALAEAACTTLFAKVTQSFPLDCSDRNAVINAVVDVVAVDSGRLIPFGARPSAHLHLLVQGWALRSHTTSNGARLITDVLLPGDLFAWRPAEFYNGATELRACGPAQVAMLRSVSSRERFQMSHAVSIVD